MLGEEEPSRLDFAFTREPEKRRKFGVSPNWKEGSCGDRMW